MSESHSGGPLRPLRAAVPTSESSSNYVPDSGYAPRPYPPHHSYPATLKRGATFNAPSLPPDEESDPILHIPSLPRRAPTCSETLDTAIDVGQRRVAGFLGQVERNLAGVNGLLRGRPSISGDDYPVPRGILTAVNTDPMETDPDTSFRYARRRLPPVNSRYRRTSDSGIGSSVSEFSVRKYGGGSGGGQGSDSQAAITKSISLRHGMTLKPHLSGPAFKNIERCILGPLLREKRFKNFHSVVKAIPQAVRRNTITCLRDLEKTLLFTASDYTDSRASYINFCEFTIQCIHGTVGLLNVPDQRRPADRPYTNGYFLDLVEQMRQYAVIVGLPNREEESTAEKKPSDILAGEELVLEGGLSTTGRPAELVRRKNGQSISMATGKPYTESARIMPATKRTLTVDSEDAGATRSMARRKKGEPPLNINKKCDHCDKVFKRPCDLAKHEKTHTRPWKCTESDCKYFTYGWPTEKERDRHINDKHCKTPHLYSCQYKDCQYQSKRESNCKQHMEKAHGWVYHRSKNTKGVKQSTPGANPPPIAPAEISTPSTASPAPFTPPREPNPLPTPTGNSPTNDFLDDYGLYPPVYDDFGVETPDFSSLDFTQFHAVLQASNPNEYVPALDINIPSVTSNAAVTLEALDAAVFGYSALGLSPDLNELDNTCFPIEDASPRSSEAAQTFGSYSAASTVCVPTPEMQPKASHLSPGGQDTMMLYSPNSEFADEGFSEVPADPSKKPLGDFTLFNSSMNGNPTYLPMDTDNTDAFGVANNPFFPSLEDPYADPTWPDPLLGIGQDPSMEDFTGRGAYQC